VWEKLGHSTTQITPDAYRRVRREVAKADAETADALVRKATS